ncbi:hypothetical protein ACFX1Q_024950 [Malus domestica]
MLHALLSSFISSYFVQPDHFDEDHVIGDCVVFDEGVFDDCVVSKISDHITGKPVVNGRKMVKEGNFSASFHRQWRSVRKTREAP